MLDPNILILALQPDEPKSCQKPGSKRSAHEESSFSCISERALIMTRKRYMATICFHLIANSLRRRSESRILGVTPGCEPPHCSAGYPELS